MSSPLTFAVSTFNSVFDTDPKSVVITFEELRAGLTRFVVKPSVRVRVERERARIQAAFDAWERGAHRAGPQYAALKRAEREAVEAGQDGREAVHAQRDTLEGACKKDAKRGLPLWSPNAYTAGARRGRAGVESLSCLVLDYDGGVDWDEASATWEQWTHIIHSTWSHTPKRPRFRLIVPLARWVPASDWPTVGDWAESRAEMRIDPTGKGIASTFALPALPSEDAPSRVSVREGPFLDLLAEGVISEEAPARSRLSPKPESAFGEGDPTKRYVTPAYTSAPTAAEWNIEEAFDDLF